MVTVSLLLVPVLISSILSLGVAAVLPRYLSSDSSVSTRLRAQGAVVGVSLLTPAIILRIRTSGQTTLEGFFATNGVAGPVGELLGFMISVCLGIPAVVVGLAVFSRLQAEDHTVRIRALPFAIGSVVAVAVGIVTVLFVSAVRHPITLPLLFTAGIPVGRSLAPRLRRRQFQTRSPTDAERDVIESVLETTGFDTDRVSIVADHSEQLWRPWISGFGRFGHLFVPERCFERYDDDALASILVHLTVSGRGDRYVTLCWSVWTGALFAVYIGLESARSVAVPALLLVLFAPIAFVALGRRRVYRRDERAARITGADSVSESLRAQVEQLGTEIRLTRLIWMKPPVESRIDRLERFGRNRDSDTQSGQGE